MVTYSTDLADGAITVLVECSDEKPNLCPADMEGKPFFLSQTKMKMRTVEWYEESVINVTQILKDS